MKTARVSVWSLFALLGCGWASATMAQVRYQVIPYFKEKAGSITNSLYTSDATIFVTYEAGEGPVPGSATPIEVKLWLYDSSGGVLKSATQTDVCNPCPYSLDAGTRKKTISINNNVLAAGGFADTKSFTGFAILSYTDSPAVGISMTGVESAFNAFDLRGNETIFRAGTGAPMVLPFFKETEGTTADDFDAVDTVFHVAYLEGFGPISGPAAGATVDLYLYDDAGTVLKSASTADVCNPCTLHLSDQARMGSFVLEDLIVANGGFPASSTTGFAIVQAAATSGHHDTVGIQTLLLEHGAKAPPDARRSLTSPPAGGASGAETRYAFLPHLVETKGRLDANDPATQYNIDTALRASFVEGVGLPRGVATSATLSLYLYESNGTGLLMSGTGNPVCNPCTIPLTSDNRTAEVFIEDLIDNAGGTFSNVILSRGVVQIDVPGGNADNVGVDAFLVTAGRGFAAPAPAAKLVAPVVLLALAWLVARARAARRSAALGKRAR